jgi:hypothetical protein
MLFHLALSIAFTQENSFQINHLIDESKIVYVIRSLDFDVSGHTRPFALIYNGGFKEGERVQGKAGLERYIAEKTQTLMNLRVLEEVVINYGLGEAEIDGSMPVRLLVYVKDTWNFIILPYPQYDSNDGLKLTLKIRDYNFFGTMSPLRIDLGFQNDTDNRKSFNLNVESNTPFKAAGLFWFFRFDHDFTYTIDEPMYYKNVTGISVELPAKDIVTTLGFNEYLVFNEINSEHDKDKYGLDDDRFNGPYAASEVFGSFKIPLPIEVGSYGGLYYTPRVAGKISYTKGGVDEPRRPIGIVSQILGFGKINWIGNFRQGLGVSLANSNNFYIIPRGWYSEIKGNAAFYYNFNKYLGFSTNLQYRQLFNDTCYDAGDVLRGIVNNRIRSEYMLSLNIDLPFRLLRFYPSELFGNSKLRFFDFELHTSPFLDFALVEGLYKQSGSREEPYEEIRFSSDDAFYCGGIEIMIFPAFMRSLYLRLSVGYDLMKIVNTRSLPKWDEIFIGIGHHY